MWVAFRLHHISDLHLKMPSITQGLILNEAMSVYMDISYTTNRPYSLKYLHTLYIDTSNVKKIQVTHYVHTHPLTWVGPTTHSYRYTFMGKMFQTLPFTNSKSKQTASKMGECLSQSYMHS